MEATRLIGALKNSAGIGSAVCNVHVSVQCAELVRVTYRRVQL